MTELTASSAAGLRGLSERDVLARRQAGQGNNYAAPSSRTYADIVRQNVFNVINIVLFTIGAVMVGIGRVSDAVVSVGLILMNVIIGVFQEIRAKRQLDRIALLTRPRVTALRDGAERALDPAEIVVGDVLVLRPGDQIVVDGTLIGEGRLEVDESQLTGESDPVVKTAGGELFSGSFVITGGGLMEVQKVGAASFANQLGAQARSFRVVKTPLQRDIDLVIRILMLVAMFMGILMLASAVLYGFPLMRSAQMAAVIAGVIPNGLFFMVIVAYAMGAVRIVRTGALVQQANSVESLSNVTVLCMDKTGTLTANRIHFETVHPLGADEATLRRLLGDFARSASVTNKTGEAIIAALPGQARPTVDEVPFSSARKWSAVACDNEAMRGVYVLGALEMLQAHLAPGPDFSDKLAEWTARGLRVLIFAGRADALSLHDVAGNPVLPPELQPLGLLCFSDELRPEARQTLAGFVEAGIALKVISGDNPQTVAALARQAGLAEGMGVVSGPELDALSDAEFAQVAEETTIFGRITPQQKERLVDALRGRGHYVAMIGDGVNDVLSLKKSQMGIAMQSGSSATRGVADMVLLNDSFAALPPAFLEGQRIINGMQDILRLFLTRAMYVTLLIIAATVMQVGFPFVPKHSSLVAFLTVGAPTLALAAWAKPRKPRGRLIQSMIHFTFPAAISVFLFGLLVYVTFFGLAYSSVIKLPITPEEIQGFERYAGITYDIPNVDAFTQEVATLIAQTALTTFSTLAGLLLVIFVEPPVEAFVGGDRLSGDRRPSILAGLLLALFVVIMAYPPLTRFFELLPFTPETYLPIVALVIVWALILRRAWRQRWFERFLGIELEW